MSLEGQHVASTPAQAPGTHTPRPAQDLKMFIIAGEHSGDALAGRMMQVINKRLNNRVRYFGVGGDLMLKGGLHSQFPLEDVAVMGPLSILPRLPRITRRVYATVNAAIASEPDVVVIVDSPEFTHPIAKRIRKRRPDIPIINYVSPSVWAWRPGRARRMTTYVDHILALLPFEPKTHQDLGGPDCTYVGHPLVERAEWLKALDPTPLALRLKLDPQKPVLVMLPGSRRSEVTRLIEIFKETIDLAAAWEKRDLQIIVPTLPSTRPIVEAHLKNWKHKTHLIEGDDDKFRALKLATAALAASGTVTLELAMAGVPAVVGYRVDRLAAQLKFLLDVPSIVLANLVAGEKVYPEFVQDNCTAVRMGRALAPLIHDGSERQAMCNALTEIPKLMRPPGAMPSEMAADIVISYAQRGRRQNAKA
jgi:lipid-A-disaccharide synthase